MSGSTGTFEFLAAQVANAETQWSLGTFGAIAEFMRDADEPAALSRGESAIAAVTERGAIRIAPPAGTRPFAFETTTKNSWSSRVALCLAENQSAMSRRTVLTEIGPDSASIREQDRNAILFDLGVGAPQADCHVRVSDPEVGARLRTHAGQSVLAPGSPAMAVILAASPHRVFLSRVGRIEVFQPIPPPHGRSPDGPHTHVLFSLLRRQRTHAATEPIPVGWIPCAHFYPAHPAKDAAGNGRLFCPQQHAAFESMLRTFGDADFVALKQRVVAAVSAGEPPAAIAIPDSRFVRTHIRVALRQLKAAGGELPALAAWTATYERSTAAAADDHLHHR